MNYLSFLLLLLINSTFTIPLYLNFPINLRNYDVNEMKSKLNELKSKGVEGVTIDVWWSLIEKMPYRYDFSFYKNLFEVVISTGLKINCSLNFHGYEGPNKIELPQWILSIRSKEEIFDIDAENNEYKAYISIFADDKKIFGYSNLRTPLEIYRDFGLAFYEIFKNYIGKQIKSLIIGVGPHGQLRYPSFRYGKSDYCKTGEFQSNSLSISLLEKLDRSVDWYYFFKKNFGNYIKHPNEKDFFNLNLDSEQKEECGYIGISQYECEVVKKCTYKQNLFDDNALWCFKTSFNYKSEIGKKFLKFYSNSLINHGERIMKIFRKIFPITRLSMKFPSIHWFFKDENRAAEKIIGLQYGDSNEAYEKIFEMSKRNRFSLIFGGLGLDKEEECKSNPKLILNLMKDLSKKYSVNLIGENPHDFTYEYDLDHILEDSDQLYELSLLRLKDFYNDIEFITDFIKKIKEKKRSIYKPKLLNVVLIEKENCGMCLYKKNLKQIFK